MEQNNKVTRNVSDRLSKRETLKELEDYIKKFANDKGLTNNDMLSSLLRLMHEFKPKEQYNIGGEKKSQYELNKEWVQSHYKDAYKDLWDLFIHLEGEVVSFLVDHPDMIKAIQTAVSESKGVIPNWVQPITFSMYIDDILTTLKGRNINGDMYIGFQAGNRDISLQ